MTVLILGIQHASHCTKCFITCRRPLDATFISFRPSTVLKWAPICTSELLFHGPCCLWAGQGRAEVLGFGEVTKKEEELAKLRRASRSKAYDSDYKCKAWREIVLGSNVSLTIYQTVNPESSSLFL